MMRVLYLYKLKERWHTLYLYKFKSFNFKECRLIVTINLYSLKLNCCDQFCTIVLDIFQIL